MARITITIEGESQEIEAIQAVLQRLAGVTAVPGAGGAAPEANRTAPREAWTLEEFQHFWSQLKDGARAILTEVARRPEGYPMRDLEQALGLPARVIGGRLSSIGHAMRRFESKEEPIEFRTGRDDGPRRVYSMKPAIARLVLRLAEGERTLGAESAESVGGQAAPVV